MPIFYIGIYFYHVTWSRQHLLHQVRSCVPCLKFLPSLITQIYFLPSQLHNFGDWSYASRFISTLVSLGSVRQQCWCHHHNHCHHQHHSGHTAALWTMHLLTFVACAAADKLVGLITCKQGSIHWFHTWRTCEASHKPVINTFHMVCMHAREVAYSITNHEFDHADHTPGNIYIYIYVVRNKNKKCHFWGTFSLQGKNSIHCFLYFCCLQHINSRYELKFSIQKRSLLFIKWNFLHENNFATFTMFSWTQQKLITW